MFPFAPLEKIHGVDSLKNELRSLFRPCRAPVIAPIPDSRRTRLPSSRKTISLQRLILMLLRDDLSLRKAQKVAFGPIFQEADALRKERNLMLHSVWFPTSNQEKTFVRVKEDERDPEIDFDVATVE